jgi:anhydro-N-acetylmuramic acid kinase
MVKIYLCGGGTHNKDLKNQLNQQLEKQITNYELLLTNQKDIDVDQLEAIAFAWLAFAYDKKFLSNMPAVTGASKGCTLGTEFLP